MSRQRKQLDQSMLNKMYIYKLPLRNRRQKPLLTGRYGSLDVSSANVITLGNQLKKQEPKNEAYF